MLSFRTQARRRRWEKESEYAARTTPPLTRGPGRRVGSLAENIVSGLRSIWGQDIGTQALGDRHSQQDGAPRRQSSLLVQTGTASGARNRTISRRATARFISTVRAEECRTEVSRLMPNAPWFKLYGSDYLLDPDVDSMPREAEALLIRMWCICHIEGSCPADAEELARKTRCSLQYVLQCKRHCEPLFELQDERFYSHRMEAEKQRSKQASENANKRYKSKTSTNGNANGSADGSANGTAQSQSQSQTINPSSELQTSSDKVSIPTQKKIAQGQPSQEASRLAALLKSEILRNKPDFRITPAQVRKWEVTADRMLRLDRRTAEQVAELIRWVTHDEFWMPNVLCMDALREKFDQLELRAKSKSSVPNKPGPTKLPSDYISAGERRRQEISKAPAGGAQ